MTADTEFKADDKAGNSAGQGPDATPKEPTLSVRLLAHRPREVSGAESANRFAYQRTWALCHLLALHEAPGDYVLILEFHDDILVLDDATDPKAADFYQVKTKSAGHWTRRELTRVPKSKPKAKVKKSKKSAKANAPAQQNPSTAEPEEPAPRSILGKLVEHSRVFEASVRSLNLISNASFKVELSASPPSTDRESFCMDAAQSTELAQFESALNAELQSQALPWSKVHFRCTSISLKEHETHATGALAEFLERRKPGGRFAVQPLYRAIAGEFARRATCEWQPSSFAELCAKKGLRRADVEGFLRHAPDRPDPEEQLRLIVATLTAEGHSYRDITALQEGWRSYDIGLTDMADTFIQEFRERVRLIVGEVASSPGWQTLAEFLQLGQTRYATSHGALVSPLTTPLLQGALLRELKNYEARKPASAGPQSQEKAP